MSAPKVFISYSHDSPQHSKRMLNFAWALREHGIDVELDQFHNEEIVDWPRWCRQQIKRDHADFVLCICTAEYQRRIDGAVPPAKGKGVYWEGSLLDDEIYNDKRNRRFIPILLDDESEACILDFLRGWTFCRLNQFRLGDSGYEHLIRILTGQVKVEKNPLGKVPMLATMKASTETVPPATAAPPPVSPIFESPPLPPPGSEPKPAKTQNRAEQNAPLVKLTRKQMLGLFAGCAAIGAAMFFASAVISFVFFALAVAVVLFGILGAVAHVENRWGKFGGSAAAFVATLLILLQFGRPDPRPVDILGMAYVDGQPVTKASIVLLGTSFSDNRREITEANPGRFEFRGVPGLGKFVEIQIDVEKPIDCPPYRREYTLGSGQIKVEVPPPTTSSELLRPPPLTPNLGRAKEALGERFIGRANELAELDNAWRSVVASANSSAVRTLGVIAWGGFGKTTLVRQWLWLHLEKYRWAALYAPEAIFWFDFGKENSADTFLTEAITYFGGNVPNLLSLATDGLKVDALKKAIGSRRFVLVLDSLESQQSDSPGDSFGQCSGFIQMLLREHTAGRFGQGLCLVTSRLPLSDFTDSSGYKKIELEQRALSDPEVRLYLEANGVTKCSSDELHQLIEATGRHPLALVTLAAFLKEHNQGDAKGWEKFRSEAIIPLSGHEEERHLWQVLSWSDKKISNREREILTVIAHFREPVKFDWLKQLLVRPEEPTGTLPTVWREDQIPSYTSGDIALPGADATEAELRRSIERLARLQLITFEKNAYFAHNLVREYFYQRTVNSNPADNKAIHTRLYRLYTSSIQPEFQPSTFDGLKPLFEAVYHGCKAGLHHEAAFTILALRINRNESYYAAKKLGLIDSIVGALRCFFDEPWSRISHAFTEEEQGDLMHDTSFFLRGMGRLSEAVGLAKASIPVAVKHTNFLDIALREDNVSQIELLLGNIVEAEVYGSRSVSNAIRSFDLVHQIEQIAAYGGVFHQAGHQREAYGQFDIASGGQQRITPNFPLLRSLAGFKYNDFMLRGVERFAWRITLNSDVIKIRTQLNTEVARHLDGCRKTTQRAAATLKYEKQNNWASLVDIAVSQLTLGRTALYMTILEGSATLNARSEINQAMTDLNRTSAQEFIIPGLLTRAWLRSLTGARTGSESAQSDLDVAWEIAERGLMKLFLTDIHLHRARLFFREKEYPWNKNPDGSARGPKDDLDAAERLINACGYHRRDEELADAKRVILGH